MTLGMVTAKPNHDEQDIAAKVSAYLALLEQYPDRVFTRSTLNSAARRFKFFPAFAELAQILDAEWREIRERETPLIEHQDNVIPIEPEERRRRLSALDECKKRLKRA